MKAAVFLERDGVINEAQLVNGHQKTPLHMDEFRIRPDVRPGLNRLKEAGFLVIITTNQPGLANGRLCRSELDLMHTMLYRALPIYDILMCPHAEGANCHCHKPEPGLFTEAAFKWHLDMDLSFVISAKGEIGFGGSRLLWAALLTTTVALMLALVGLTRKRDRA